MEQPKEQDFLPSLLWPLQSNQAPPNRLSDQQALDLGLDLLVQALDWDGRHTQHVRTVLSQLVTDEAVIAYRQEILAELAANDRLREAIAALVPRLAELARPHTANWAQESILLTVPPRLTILEHYLACLQCLQAALADGPELKSQGLRHLRDYVVATLHRTDVQALAEELPLLRDQFDQVGSITVGINLDRDLRPAAVTLVSVNRELFSGPLSLIGRLLGRAAPSSLPSMTVLRDVLGRSPDVDPLARDLQRVLEEVVKPVAVALERYQRIHVRPLAQLGPELAFYLGAVRMGQQLQSIGLPVCLPTVDNGSHMLNLAYNPGLALQLAANSNNGNAPAAPPLVCNLIDFNAGRIAFVTGPNRGGKTTYLRAVGLNQILFQAGVWVAASSACMAPVDAILTHFPPVERVEPGVGRLDDEARRLREIFGRATPSSLLLLNEPLTSTAESEALLLSQDVLRALRLLDARTVFVTHLHTLAEELDAINGTEPGTRVVSWVAEVNGGIPTYIIHPGRPAARSYAQRIAQQHGITFEQLAQQLQDRGIQSSKFEQ
jgi:DNA mismatch repair protein MutS